jgi:ArsR family transcriptional regulator, virulence genes transcriptional regulator
MEDYKKQNLEKLDRAYKLVLLLSKKSTRLMLKLLSGRELTVTQIYVELRKDQSNASSVLRGLRKEEIVCYRTDGLYKYYSINTARISEINAAIAKM